MKMLGKDICRELGISVEYLAQLCDKAEVQAYSFDTHSPIMASSQCKRKFIYPYYMGFNFDCSNRLLAIEETALDKMQMMGKEGENWAVKEQDGWIRKTGYSNLLLNYIIFKNKKYIFINFFKNIHTNMFSFTRSNEISFILKNNEIKLDLLISTHEVVYTNDLIHYTNESLKNTYANINWEQKYLAIKKVYVSDSWMDKCYHQSDNCDFLRSKGKFFPHQLWDLWRSRINDGEHSFSLIDLDYLYQDGYNYYSNDYPHLLLQHEKDFFCFNFDDFYKRFYFMYQKAEAYSKFLNFIKEYLVFESIEVEQVSAYIRDMESIQIDPVRYMIGKCKELLKNSCYEISPDDKITIQTYLYAIESNMTWEAIFEKLYNKKVEQIPSFINKKHQTFIKNIAPRYKIPAINPKSLRDINKKDNKKEIVQEMLNKLKKYYK